MLSITQLQKNIYPLFYIMRRTGAVLEIVYKGVVYDVHVQQTKKKPIMNRAKRSRLTQTDVKSLATKACPLCGGLMVAGVCLNKDCFSTNSLG